MRSLPAPWCEQSLADRLMVGLRFLVPSIGVRVPVRQLQQLSYIYQYEKFESWYEVYFLL